MMKPVLLQFESLTSLALFSKEVNDRGYVLIVKDLTLQISLTNAECQKAVEQYGAKLSWVNRAAA